VDPSPEATGKCLTALSGSGQLGPDETTWLIDIHWLALAGQDYSHGKAKVFGSKYGLGKKRGPSLGKTKGGKSSKWMVVVDGQAVPIGAGLDSA